MRRNAHPFYLNIRPAGLVPCASLRYRSVQLASDKSSRRYAVSERIRCGNSLYLIGFSAVSCDIFCRSAQIIVTKRDTTHDKRYHLLCLRCIFRSFLRPRICSGSKRFNIQSKWEALICPNKEDGLSVGCLLKCLSTVCHFPIFSLFITIF